MAVADAVRRGGLLSGPPPEKPPRYGDMTDAEFQAGKDKVMRQWRQVDFFGAGQRGSTDVRFSFKSAHNH